MENSTTIKSTWIQNAAKKGVILGAIHIVVMLILYAFLPSKLTGFSYIFFIIVLNFGYAIYSGKQWRNEVGGFLSFGEAFKYVFVLLFANGILGIVFSVIFLLLDPSYPEVMAESQMNTSIYWAQKFGAPDDAIEQMKEKFDPEVMAKQYTLSAIPKGLGIAVILYSIGALIMAIFVRKEQPEML
jgi:hypothetical protein